MDTWLPSRRIPQWGDPGIGRAARDYDDLGLVGGTLAGRRLTDRRTAGVAQLVPGAAVGYPVALERRERLDESGATQIEHVVVRKRADRSRYALDECGVFRMCTVVDALVRIEVVARRERVFEIEYGRVRGERFKRLSGVPPDVAGVYIAGILPELRSARVTYARASVTAGSWSSGPVRCR